MNKLNTLDAKMDILLDRNGRQAIQNFDLLPNFPMNNIVDLETFNTNLQATRLVQAQYVGVFIDKQSLSYIITLAYMT